MSEQEVDLSKLFNAVTKALKTEQASLNEADSYNHDHGDNMVTNFKVITKALKQKQGASPMRAISLCQQGAAPRNRPRARPTCIPRVGPGRNPAHGPVIGELQ